MTEAPKAETQKAETPERRVKQTAPDAQGVIHADGYTGPDRRAFREAQKKRIRDEKLAFINRTTLSVGFITAAVLYAVYFTLAPEIAAWTASGERARAAEAQVAEMRAQIDALKKQQAEAQEKAPLGSAVSRKIEEAKAAAGEAAEKAASAAANVAASVAAVAPEGMRGALESVAQGAQQDAASAASPAVESLIRVLSAAQALDRTEEGRAQIAAALARLKAALALQGDMNAAVSTARLQDPTLDRLLAGVDPRNIGAAGAVLAVNQLRFDLGGGRPFGDELALVSRLTGAEALASSSPYAESGVTGREELERQFPAVAGDIVMAKFSNPDDSLKAQALARLAQLVKVRRTDDIKGDTPDAIVARAEVALSRGDVAGAVGALSALQGPPADKAAPWVRQAEGYVAAQGASEVLAQTILQVLSASAGPRGVTLEGVLAALKENLSAAAPPPPSNAPVPYLSPALQEKPAPILVAPFREKK
jgi:hypothetical protein